MHSKTFTFKTLLSKATYSAFRLYICFCQYVCSLGIEPTTFCTANAMLYHWAIGTQRNMCLFQEHQINMICNLRIQRKHTGITRCKLKILNKNNFLFVTYTIIPNITSSEICALHLTHSKAHTPGAVGSQCCSAQGAVGGSVPCSKVSTSVEVLKVERTLIIH